MTKDMKDIYEKYCNSIYRYLLLLTKNEQLSEELTQETFYQAIKSINKFSGKCSIYTWLCSIAKNCFKNYVKKNQRYVYYDNIEIISIEPSSEVGGLYNAINKLESPYKEIVQLHIYDEIPLKEIAKILGKSESYARVMFHRAKDMLRKELTKDEM